MLEKLKKINNIILKNIKKISGINYLIFIQFIFIVTLLVLINIQNQEIQNLTNRVDQVSNNIKILDSNDQINKKKVLKHIDKFIENRIIVSQAINNLEDKVLSLDYKVTSLEPSLLKSLNDTKEELSIEIRSIPKGEKGDRGPVGPVGPVGPQGIAGGMTPSQEEKLNNVISEVSSIKGFSWYSFSDKNLSEINDCLDGIESSLRNLSSYVNTYTGSDSINHLRSSVFGGYYSQTSYVGPYVTFITFDSIYPSGC